MAKIIRVRNKFDVKPGKLYQIYDKPDRELVENYDQAIEQDYKDSELGIIRIPVVIVKCTDVNYEDEEFYGPVLISAVKDHPVGDNDTDWNLHSPIAFQWMEVNFDDDESLDLLIEQ